MYLKVQLKIIKKVYLTIPRKSIEKFDDIMNIILPTLGSERRKTYSPFLPICPETGKVLEIPVTEIDKKNKTLVFDNDGKKIKTRYFKW